MREPAVHISTGIVKEVISLNGLGNIKENIIQTIDLKVRSTEIISNPDNIQIYIESSGSRNEIDSDYIEKVVLNEELHYYYRFPLGLSLNEPISIFVRTPFNCIVSSHVTFHELIQ